MPPLQMRTERRCRLQDPGPSMPWPGSGLDVIHSAAPMVEELGVPQKLSPEVGTKETPALR